MAWSGDPESLGGRRSFGDLDVARALGLRDGMGRDVNVRGRGCACLMECDLCLRGAAQHINWARGCSGVCGLLHEREHSGLRGKRRDSPHLGCGIRYCSMWCAQAQVLEERQVCTGRSNAQDPIPPPPAPLEHHGGRWPVGVS